MIRFQICEVNNCWVGLRDSKIDGRRFANGKPTQNECVEAQTMMGKAEQQRPGVLLLLSETQLISLAKLPLNPPHKFKDQGLPALLLSLLLQNPPCRSNWMY